MKTCLALTLWMMGLILTPATLPAGQTGLYPVQAAIQQYIDANMPWPPETVRVDFLSGEPEIKVRGKGVTLRVEPAGNNDFIGDMVFLVRYFREGTLLKTETVRARIEIQRDVVTAARMLSSGTVLVEGDLRIVRRWVRRLHPQALSSPVEATGRRLTMQARAGAEIVASMLKDAPLARKGRIVRVVFDNGLMHIDTVGLMEEDGMAGSIVRVKNITSNKIIYGRVLSDSLVSIEF